MPETISDNIIVSIVILNWNRSDDLSELLDSLRKQSVTGFEVIVVDNSSRDDSLAMLEQHHPDVRTIVLPKNQGVSGFNVGVDHARGKYTLLLDNDTILPPHCLEKVYEKVNAHPDVSVFALNIVTLDGIRQQDYLPQNASSPTLWHNFIGGGVVFLTSDYMELGGYDPSYFIYINETEFSARILLAGKRILYCPNIEVIHKTSRTARMSESSYFYFLINSLLFMKTYFKSFKKCNLILGFLLINLRKSIAENSLKIFIRAILEGVRIVPTYKPQVRLGSELAKRLACSWQGDPSFTQIIVNKLCKKFK